MKSLVTDRMVTHILHCDNADQIKNELEKVSIDISKKVIEACATFAESQGKKFRKLDDHAYATMMDDIAANIRIAVPTLLGITE